MKRQLRIVVLIACILLATVPTALCKNEVVKVTDSNTVLQSPIFLNVGDTLKVIVPNAFADFIDPFTPAALSRDYNVKLIINPYFSVGSSPISNGVFENYNTFVSGKDTLNLYYRAINYGSTDFEFQYIDNPYFPNRASSDFQLYKGGDFKFTVIVEN